MLSTLESAIYQDTKTTIGQETLLYTQLEYNLKLCLNSSTARISSCSVISNTHLSDQFIKLSNDQLTLYTWIDSSDLVGGNTEEDVLRRGFQFISPSKGMHISIGSFKPPSKGPSHKALLCQVLIGRSYAIEKSNVQNAELPPGYKSFYIQDESPHSSADYIHQYYIKNPLHILPRYLVQFDYDPQVEAASRQKQKCEDCEKEMATIYCEADKAYLCKSCDANLHKTKISKSHVRKAIGEGVDVFGNCKTHPTRQIQYFCSQCHEPVCIDCTILGSHAKYKADGEGPHTLVSVEEYFRTVLEESKTPSPHLNERLVAINDQINNIQSRADAVVEMGKQITTAIDEICSAAKKECNDIILKKLTVLNGDEHELRRQIGEINCLEEFLKYQQEGDSMACVSTWHLHQMFREKLCDFQFFRQDIDVQLDAKISGSLSVVVDQDKVALSAPPHSTSTSTSNSPQKKPNLPQRSETPQDMYYRPPSVASAYHVPSAPSPYGVLTPRMSMAGKNKLHKSPERKMERRTSDFFNEALNFGQDMMSDFDSYSQLSSK